MSTYWEVVYWLTIRPRLNRLKKLLPEASIHPTGSRYICDPPVLVTDIDFLVYISELDKIILILNREGLEQKLTKAGYKKTDNDNYRGIADVDGLSRFTTWRKGVINLIITSSVEFAESFQTATSICKRENIREKWHRTLIHEALRGNYDHELVKANLMPEMVTLLDNFNGMHGHAIHKAYRVRHGLEL